MRHTLNLKICQLIVPAASYLQILKTNTEWPSVVLSDDLSELEGIYLEVTEGYLKQC
jgi:hypothetical protein